MTEMIYADDLLLIDDAGGIVCDVDMWYKFNTGDVMITVDRNEIYNVFISWRVWGKLPPIVRFKILFEFKEYILKNPSIVDESLFEVIIKDYSYDHIIRSFVELISEVPEIQRLVNKKKLLHGKL